MDIFQFKSRYQEHSEKQLIYYILVKKKKHVAEFTLSAPPLQIGKCWAFFLSV